MGLTLAFLVIFIGGLLCSAVGMFCCRWIRFRRLFTGVGCVCGLISLIILCKADMLFVASPGFPPWCDLSLVSIVMMIVFPLDIIITRRKN